MPSPSERPESPSGYAITLVAVLMIGVGMAASMLQPTPEPPAPPEAKSEARGKNKKNQTGERRPAKQSAKKPEVSPKRPVLERSASMQMPGAEIAAYDPKRKRVLVTGSGGVSAIQLAFDATPTLIATLDVGAAAGFPRGIAATATHVAVDPVGRGFAAVTVVPTAKARMPGSVVFVDLDEAKPIGSVSVGFNPDALAFTPDGVHLVVLNEGEPELVRDVVVDPPGSVSVIDLTHVTAREMLRNLTPSDVTPMGFHGGAVSVALTRMNAGERPALRVHPANLPTPELDIEPESLVIEGGLAYITLQENNALAVLDVAKRTWISLKALPPVQRQMDASDSDGGAKIDDTLASLPCPDQIGVFRAGGKSYLLVCEEGDDRGNVDDAVPPPMADQARIAWLASQGRLAPAFMAGVDLSDAGLGRLRVCSFSGDPNNDGSINQPVALGTRSVGIYDGGTLARVGDTGSQFEEGIAKSAPNVFNADGKDLGKPDARSDDRGPEPEGVAIAEIGDRQVAFVTLERPGAIAVIDLSTPAAPRVTELVTTAQQGDFGPEGAVFVPAGVSPTGKPLLVVAFEASGTLAIYRVNMGE
jgi:DNA-binding beta-propeller fold protein YncE